MNVLALITAILQAAPEELALVEALIGIAKGTHVITPVTTATNPTSASVAIVPDVSTLAAQTVTATPVVTEVAAPVVPPNGKKLTLT